MNSDDIRAEMEDVSLGELLIQNERKRELLARSPEGLKTLGNLSLASMEEALLIAEAPGWVRILLAELDEAHQEILSLKKQLMAPPIRTVRDLTPDQYGQRVMISGMAEPLILTNVSHSSAGTFLGGPRWGAMLSPDTPCSLLAASE